MPAGFLLTNSQKFMPSLRALLKIPGARKAAMPGFVEPCHATAATRVPAGTEWSHEIKFDGYRVQAHIEEGDARLFTRRGYDWTSRFATIAAELRQIHVSSAILDGEILVADETGRSNFHWLQADLAKGRVDRLVYSVFDLLFLNGVDLRGAPLRERRRLLQEIIRTGNQRIVFSEAIQARSTDLLKHACAMKLEGILSKQLDAAYRSGRQDTWLKIKCNNSADFPIIAFVEKLGARPRRIASLYLGRFEGDKLLYAGKAQTGFNTDDLYLLRERLDPYITANSPLTVPIKKPKATWVRPELYAEVEYSSLTADGLLRSPVYKGLRDDLTPAGPPTDRFAHRSSRRPSGRVPRENILQLLPDAVPPSEEALKHYWSRVHAKALPYLARRPLKLVRSIAGATFYHKGALPEVPASVHQLKVRKREGGEGTRVWVDDLKGLLGLVDMNVVEVHPWNGTVDDIECADTMVFDLDPGPGTPWSFVVDTALTLRELLEQQGCKKSWPKLTGGKGVHVMVPLPSRVTHDQAHHRSRAIAESLADLDPDRYTTSSALSARPGRLFLDYLRNGRGTTAVGAFSPRARANHSIAAPVTWRDIEQGIRPDAYTMDNLPPTARTRHRSMQRRRPS